MDKVFDKVFSEPTDIVMPVLSHRNPLFDILPIIVKTLSRREIGSSHWHNYLQIWYTVSGNWLYTANGITYPQAPGSIGISFPYMLHKIDTSDINPEKDIIIQISVKKGFLESKGIPFLGHTYKCASFKSFYLDPHTILTGQDKQVADCICTEIYSEYEKHFAMRINKTTEDISRILELCVKNAESSANKHELDLVRTRVECINNAMEYISSNSPQKITIDEISNSAMMSRSTFTSAFKTVTGQTFHNCITSLRIARAYQLLKHTDRSVSEIAEECGFFNSSHLSRVCRELLGVSPLTLRKKIGIWMREHGDELFHEDLKNTAWASIYDEDSFEMHQISMLHY